jgi:PAS domain S-box-containing protein
VKKGNLLFLIIALIAVCSFLFTTFYAQAKKAAVEKLNEEQMIHAKQAAHGIEEFFTTWTGVLTSFSGMNDVIDVTPDGKKLLELFHEAHKAQVSSITRVDEYGVIIFTVPYPQSIGSDISRQKHIRDILKNRKPVLSDVFRTVQGFEAVALHVPVFKGNTFKGTIAVVIDFKSLAKQYLEVIRIGETGSAWVISRDGVELYDPVPGYTGKSVFESCKRFPSLTPMVQEMLKGRQGVATYTFDRIGEQRVVPVIKHAVYMPIHIGNTFWSIAVASSEKEMLSSLTSFRNKLILIVGILFLGGVLFALLAAKAWLIVGEEKKRMQAEDELRSSEQRYRYLFEQNPAPMLIYQRGTLRILAVNEAFLRHYGYSAGEALTLRLPDLYPDEEKEPIARLAERLKGHAYVGEWHHLKSDGSLITIVARSHDMEYFGLDARIAVITDITDMKRMECLLRESEVRFRESMEFLPIPIAISDSWERIVYVNREFTRTYGYELNDIPTVDAWAQRAYPDPAYRERAFAQWDRDVADALEKGTATQIREYRVVCGDGGSRDVEICMRQMGDLRVTSFNDVTERRRTEEELRSLNETLDQKVRERTSELEAANQRLQELDRLKSTFIASMSHELRTPLNSIIGFTGILLQELAGPLNEEQRKQLGMVKSSSRHLLGLVTDIIDLSKIEAGKLMPCMESFDLSLAAREALETLRVTADRKSLQLEIETPEQLMMESDHRRVLQILVNLIGNAVKFTEKGAVTVNVREEKGAVRVSVRDSGPGIRQEDMDRLFRFFSRIVSEEGPLQEGTGLGLYLSKKMANLLGGDITAESEFGTGSVFTLTLPLRKMEAS